MNQREYKKSGKFKGKHLWYNKTRKIQKSLQYNPDPEARVLHHLRDTPEQREYNDTYYELWGHNLDGTFEYGKYVIFVTKKQHTEIHRCSKETRSKLSAMNSGPNNYWFGKHITDDMKLKISIANKKRFSNKENHPMYGKHHSDETKEKLSIANKGKVIPEETKRKISETAKLNMIDERRQIIGENSKNLWKDEAYRERQITRLTGENNPMYGKKHSDEAKEKNRKAHLGENNANYGKHLSDETKRKIGEANKIALRGKKLSEETKRKMSESRTGRVVSDDTRLRLSNEKKEKATLFKIYKSNGGQLSWNDFQKAIKHNIESLYIYIKDSH